jgi:hypothetical protein
MLPPYRKAGLRVEGENVIAVRRNDDQNSQGLRAEQIRAKLGLTRKELDPSIINALAAKQIRKKGDRRATTYFVL